MTSLTIHKKDRIVRGKISLPASKSLSNRALILNQICGGKLNIRNLSEADDTKLLSRLLNQTELQKNTSETISLDCQNAGTVFRFLTSYLSLRPGKWFLTGSPRMKERPIGQLADSLNLLGASVSYAGENGFPPLMIEGKTFAGGDLEFTDSLSSQFISALMMIGPVLQGGLRIKLKSRLASTPYIRMTLEMLKICGIQAEFSENIISIPEQEFCTAEIDVEPDWSSAAFWYEIAALADDADLELTGLEKHSLQGDAILPEIFISLGVKTEFLSTGVRLIKRPDRCHRFEFGFTDIPDLAQAVAVTCAALNIPAKITGLHSLKIKETDRICALITELKKCGFHVNEYGGSAIRIDNTELKTLNPEPIHSYGDHRMAMAFAPLALVFDSIRIENPEVVSKSYPGFWDDLIKAGFNY